MLISQLAASCDESNDGEVSGGPSAAPFDFAQDKLRTGVGAASAILIIAQQVGMSIPVMAMIEVRAKG